MSGKQVKELEKDKNTNARGKSELSKETKNVFEEVLYELWNRRDMASQEIINNITESVDGEIESLRKAYYNTGYWTAYDEMICWIARNFNI